MDLGARIAAWRKVKHMSERDLADAIGVTPAAVYQWEGSGKTKTVPSIANLEAVVKAFGLTMGRFYGRVPGSAKKAS